MSALLGVDIGTLLAMLVGGQVIESYGWQWLFYGNGAIGLVVCALWFACVYDTPAMHPRIAAAERQYIEKSIAGESMNATEIVADVAQKGKWPPFGAMLTSLSFWVLMIAQYAEITGTILVIMGAPRFLHVVLGYDLAWSGALLGAAFLMRPITGLAFAALADWLLGTERLTCASVRKGFMVFCMVSSFFSIE